MSSKSKLFMHNLVKKLFPGFFYRAAIKIYIRTRYFLFYLLSKKKIDAVYGILADDLSRDTLAAYIYCRRFADPTPLLKLTRPRNLMYFDDLVKLREDVEVFADIGSLNGNDSKRFARLTNNKYKAIYMFEPDPGSYEKSKEAAKNLQNSHVFNEAVYDKDGEISFKHNLEGGSKISSKKTKQTVQVSTIKLDNKKLDPAPTILKMDIEGAEAGALLGARDLIKSNEPTLIVCMYHKKDDVFVLPNLMAELMPCAKLYIRHYGYPEQISKGPDFLKNLDILTFLSIPFDLVSYAIANESSEPKT